jgi:acetoin utilization deacetylase AcuC-like enzyme
MSKTAVVMDPVFLTHDTGPGHPERPERLERIYGMLEAEGLMDRLDRTPLREAADEELLRIHGAGHLKRIDATAGQGCTHLDGDTPTGPGSSRAARLAAGGLLNAVDSVLAGESTNAFALVRPPGHHAERDQAMGFCLYNNVAVAAAHAMAAHGLERVLVVDWDVHHGNGTQHIFYDDPRALYFSTHRYPFYPGTGSFKETGAGAGKGYTVNVPLPGGCEDAVFDACFAQVLAPVARKFRPQAILVSAGFDTHREDPLGGMRMTEDGFARLTGRIEGLAAELCGGKTIYALEGGYDLTGLARSVTAVIQILSGQKSAPTGDLEPPVGFERLIQKEREYLAESWPEIGG